MSDLLSDPHLHALSLASIVHRCRRESVRYLNQQDHDAAFCYELFRRALADQEQAAWEALYTQYVHHTPVVIRWVRQHPQYAVTHEDPAYFANRAFARFWSAVTPEKFAQFPDLRSLLRYLKLCVNSTITDYLRTQSSRHLDSSVATEENLLLLEETDTDAAQQRLENEELWRLIENRLHDDREHLVLFCRYVEGMKPSQICTVYSDLFPDVQEIYQMLQTILARLRRDPLLRAYFAIDGETDG